MAEVVAFRNNALPYPIYAQSWTIVAPLLDADGDPISPSSPDSEVSKNGDTFADCTNEATEIATSSGVVYLTLTAAEMTADIVTVRIQSTGAKSTIITLYPRKLPVLSSGTCQGSNDTGDIQLASGDSAVNDYYNGCLIVAVIDATTEARIINDYVGSTKVAEISPAWNTAQPDSDDTYTIYLPEGRQVQPINVTYWNGTAVPSEHTAGYPIVTIKDGTGTGEINTNAGAVALVDLVTTTTTATTATNLTNERGKYANGSVWIGPSANTNTTSYTDGIITNPVSTVAAAKTIADALNIRKFQIIRTGAVQIGADMVGYDFDGTQWTCTTTGGSRDVSSSSFHNALVTGGTYASTSAASYWEYCEFSTGVSVAAVNMQHCTFAGTLTLNAAGNYDFLDCASVVAGTSAPVFAVPAGTVNISFRRWSGGIRITGITSATTISIDIVSGGTVTLEGADGNVQVRGMVSAITDSRTGSPTLGTNAVINQTLIATPTNLTAGTIANVTNPVTATVNPATISGVFSTVPIANLSGVVANSGLFVSVLPVNVSGVFATVLPANLSGVIANSGLFTTVLPANLSGVIANSGLFATVLPANLSGIVANSGLSVTTTVTSGSLYLASGSVFVNTFSSGTLNQMAIANVVVNLSGIEAQIPAQSPGAAALKLTSRFNARSGATYKADGTTVFMTQSVTTASSQQPIVELGTGTKP